MPQGNDLTLLILSQERARLLGPQRLDHAGAIQLDEDLRIRLLELEHGKDYDAYGRTLFAAVFPAGSDLARGLYSALDAARGQGRRLRLRLDVDPASAAAIHGLHWELLTDGRDFAPARSPEIVFSRYVSLPHPVAPAPTRPRLLCVVAAPTDAHRYQMAPIDYDLTSRQLTSIFSELQGTLDFDVLERPASLGRLRDRLRDGSYHLLHVHGHGLLPRDGEAALVLENDEHRVQFVSESTLCSVFLGLRDLRLVTLVACNGGLPSTQDNPLSGLAGALVRHGVPAVIAMRRSISLEMGLRFTRHLYRQLALDSTIDAAVNEARHGLYLENPSGIEWSSPVLTLRLEDGRLWSSPPVAAVPIRSRRWRPALLLPLVALLAVILASPYFLLAPKRDEAPSRDTVVVQEVPAQEPIQEEGTTQDDEPPSSDPATVEEPRPQAPPPTLPFTTIVTGKVGVGAVAKDTSTWSSDTTRILVRQLRQLRPDLDPVAIPEAMRSQLPSLLEGDLAWLPGGDRSPQGYEYLLLVTERHGSHTAATAPFPTVRVECDMLLIATRQPEVRFEEALSQLGQDTTEGGALEQAFERCVESSLGAFPYP